MLTATQQTRRLIFQQCRICHEYEGCWGDCHGKEIDGAYLKTEDLGDGLGPPPAEPRLDCFRLAENRDGDFDPVTGDLMSESPVLPAFAAASAEQARSTPLCGVVNHKPILQG